MTNSRTTEWSGGVVAMVVVCVIASPDRAAAANVWISSSAIGYWLLAIGYWLLAIGYWLLAIGYARTLLDSVF
jgi:hypothetical protein